MEFQKIGNCEKQLLVFVDFSILDLVTTYKKAKSLKLEKCLKN